MFDISDTAHRKKKYLIVPSGPYMEGKLKHLVKCTALCSRPGPAPTRSRADRLLRGRILQSTRTLEGTDRRDHPLEAFPSNWSPSSSPPTSTLYLPAMTSKMWDDRCTSYSKVTKIFSPPKAFRQGRGRGRERTN